MGFCSCAGASPSAATGAVRPSGMHQEGAGSVRRAGRGGTTCGLTVFERGAAGRSAPCPVDRGPPPLLSQRALPSPPSCSETSPVAAQGPRFTAQLFCAPSRPRDPDITHLAMARDAKPARCVPAGAGSRAAVRAGAAMGTGCSRLCSPAPAEPPMAPTVCSGAGWGRSWVHGDGREGAQASGGSASASHGLPIRSPCSARSSRPRKVSAPLKVAVGRQSALTHIGVPLQVGWEARPAASASRSNAA